MWKLYEIVYWDTATLTHVDTLHGCLRTTTQSHAAVTGPTGPTEPAAPTAWPFREKRLLAPGLEGMPD